MAGQNQALLARVRLEQVNRTVVTFGGHQGPIGTEGDVVKGPRLCREHGDAPSTF